MRAPANGTAAAYNAGAEFEAASTLKLPVMVVALTQNRGELHSSRFWDPFVRVTSWSDNAAANELLTMTGGSETGGAALMVRTMRALGLRHTSMSGGYLTGAGGGPPAVSAPEPPPAAYKHTTAADMATLAGFLADAAVGEGPLERRGVDRHEARELLYLMLHAQDEGLVRAGAGGLPVAHKIGWLDETRNDVAIVFTSGGPVAISIFTYGTIDTTVTNFGAAATRAVLRAART